MKRKLGLLLLGIVISIFTYAQDTARHLDMEQRTSGLEEKISVLEKVKFSGYIQAQFQWGQENVTLKVGEGRKNSEGSYSRVGIRRGRLKMTATDRLGEGVFEIDINDGGMKVRNVYASINDPLKIVSFRLGIFDRCFGYELMHSSSNLESMERSRVVNTLMPDEKDLGGMLQLQAPKRHVLNFLKLWAGLFSGNGIGKDADGRKDFIGRLSATKDVGKFVKLGGGVSYYNGGVYQPKTNYYKMGGSDFIKDTCTIGDYAKKEYVGADVQLSVLNALGKTTIRLEYITGQQPGIAEASTSCKDGTNFTDELYLRPFMGGYAILVHDILKTKFAVVAKYDYYDPNTKVSGSNIGLGETTAADIAYGTVGVGGLCRITKYLTFQIYYDFVFNEKTDNIVDFRSDRKDNFLSCRLQYKF
ncbi:MAG: hypothetical protein LBH34_05560 [Prevotellaceae bacterium]|jgi:hypothetical protein|nr:hypothetical protein [Prevotellaceae bacterium]